MRGCETMLTSENQRSVASSASAEQQLIGKVAGIPRAKDRAGKALAKGIADSIAGVDSSQVTILDVLFSDSDTSSSTSSGARRLQVGVAIPAVVEGPGISLEHGALVRISTVRVSSPTLAAKPIWRSRCDPAGMVGTSEVDFAAEIDAEHTERSSIVQIRAVTRLPGDLPALSMGVLFLYVLCTLHMHYVQCGAPFQHSLHASS